MKPHKAIPTDDRRKMNRRAARKQAQKRDIDPSALMFCPGCGRTVIRRQKRGNPGYKDKLFCTCEEIGLPMTPVEG